MTRPSANSVETTDATRLDRAHRHKRRMATEKRPLSDYGLRSERLLWPRTGPAGARRGAPPGTGGGGVATVRNVTPSEQEHSRRGGGRRRSLVRSGAVSPDVPAEYAAPAADEAVERGGRLRGGYAALGSVLGRLGIQGQVIGQNELALYSALFETHDQASLAHFLEATIGPLIEHDRRRSSELASTLLIYFDCNQNAKTTAQRLGIHVNTVRQRLATIEDMLGHWGQAARALEIHMALRLWSLSAQP